MGNRITPYKNREIDYSLPVYIYRNLHKRGVEYSIRQKGLVVGHTDAVAVRDAQFIVNNKGQERVRREKRKNVHAFVKGIISQDGVMGTTAIREERITNELPLPCKILYNPYQHNSFFYTLGAKRISVNSAQGVIINRKGVFGAYIS